MIRRFAEALILVAVFCAGQTVVEVNDRTNAGEQHEHE